MMNKQGKRGGGGGESPWISGDVDCRAHQPPQWAQDTVGSLYIYTSSFDLIITGSLNPSEMKPVAPTWFVFSSLLCATFSDDPIASVSTTKTLIFSRASRSEGADAH